tara:strand:+ start:6399 stop:7208 length:810 start_codon:yes stop_codon:yes gene_type:complete
VKKIENLYLKRERNIHNKWAKENNYEPFNIKAFKNGISLPEFKWLLNKQNLKNKKILDIGCGLGEASIYFAMQGADVSAIDISDKVIEKGSKEAKKYKVQINFIKNNGENLDMFKDEYFDYIYASNLLHHLNIQTTIKQIYLKLKKNGIFLSWDPIAYNPLINIYRKLASKVRTDDEQPLKKKDILLICENFNSYEIKYFWLTGLLVFIKFFLFDFQNPSKTRYWKKVVYEEKKYAKFLKITHRIDNQIIKIFPFLKYLMWNVAIRAKK